MAQRIDQFGHTYKLFPLAEIHLSRYTVSTVNNSDMLHLVPLQSARYM